MLILIRAIQRIEQKKSVMYHTHNSPDALCDLATQKPYSANIKGPMVDMHY